MFSSILYIAFSVLDSFAVHSLVHKLYKLPMRRYKYHIFGCTVMIALISFLMRVKFEMQIWDLPVQYIIYLLFYRFVLKYRLHISAFIIGSGLSAYISLQMIIYYLISLSGVVTKSVILDTNGIGVYLIQLSSIGIALIIAGMLRRTEKGFSFVDEPPHDFIRRINYYEYRSILTIISACLSAVAIMLTLWLLIVSNYYGILALSLATFGIAYYFSDREDYERVRQLIETTGEEFKET